MNKSISTGDQRKMHSRVKWIGLAQALIVLLIAGAFIWNASQMYSTVSPLSSYVSIVLVCMAVALVPLSMINVVLVVNALRRNEFKGSGILLVGVSLLISVVIIMLAIWVGNSLFLLIDSANRANALQASTHLSMLS